MDFLKDIISGNILQGEEKQKSPLSFIDSSILDVLDLDSRNDVLLKSLNLFPDDLILQLTSKIDTEEELENPDRIKEIIKELKNTEVQITKETLIERIGSEKQANTILKILNSPDIISHIKENVITQNFKDSSSILNFISSSLKGATEENNSTILNKITNLYKSIYKTEEKKENSSITENIKNQIFNVINSFSKSEFENEMLEGSQNVENKNIKQENIFQKIYSKLNQEKGGVDSETLKTLSSNPASLKIYLDQLNSENLKVTNVKNENIFENQISQLTSNTNKKIDKSFSNESVFNSFSNLFFGENENVEIGEITKIIKNENIIDSSSISKLTSQEEVLKMETVENYITNKIQNIENKFETIQNEVVDKVLIKTEEKSNKEISKGEKSPVENIKIKEKSSISPGQKEVTKMLTPAPRTVRVLPSYNDIGVI